MKKVIKHSIALLLAVIMMVSISPLKPYADDTKDSGILPTDVYIVIDNSWSMAKEDDGVTPGGSDPNRLAIQCAEAFYQESPANNSAIGVITFSGNGEPTLHPDFLYIMQNTCALRDRYCPSAKVSVLSNSTQLGRPDVVEALRLCDHKILKLDAATDEMMRRIDQPVNRNLTISQLIEWLVQFKGEFILQTCFLRGEHNGQIIDNTTSKELEAWYHAVEQLHPKQIMIYVIDRKTPEEKLEKISREEMERIAAPLLAKGYDVIISA